MTEDDTYRRLKRTPFPELREIVDKKAKDLNSLLTILQQNSWNTVEWKAACEEESARLRPPLKIPPPKPPKSTPAIPSSPEAYGDGINCKDNKFAPPIKNISEYMRNLTIIKG